MKINIEKTYEFLDNPKTSRLILVVLLILSVLFSLFYYMVLSKVSQQDVGALPGSPSLDLELTKDTDDSKKGEDLSVVEESEYISRISKTVYSIELSEIKKVQDFLDIKANRTATLELIKDARDKKESYYKDVYSYRGSLSDDAYSMLESMLIGSMAMSESFLDAFNSKTTHGDLREILKKYK